MYSGSCHCGRVAFKVDGAFSQVIECNCSHCIRKGYLLWFVQRDQLAIEPGGEANLSTYLFNKHVIRHQFCSHCGCAPFAFGTDPKGQATAAINVRCLEGVDLGAVERIPYDGRSA